MTTERIAAGIVLAIIIFGSFFGALSMSARGETLDPRYPYLAIDAATVPKKPSHRTHGHSHKLILDANGNLSSGLIRSHKTGATAHVSAQYARMFQAYIDDIESTGASVRFMGGIRRGHCSLRHLHPCGRALDVCQLSRGRVDLRCRLPRPDRLAEIARAHGLFEGSLWCNSDYGHAQVGVTAQPCGMNVVASARRHRNRVVMR